MSRKSHRRKKPRTVVGIDLSQNKDHTGYVTACNLCHRQYLCKDRTRGIQCNFFLR